MKIKRKYLLVAIVLLIPIMLLSFAACNKAAGNDASINGNYENKIETDGGSTSEESTPERKIIYYARLSMKIGDIDGAIGSIKGKLNADEWVESESIGQNYASVVVRVKSARLDDFVKSVSGEGEITDYNKTSEDISLSYSDTADKIATLEKERTTLVALYEKAGVTVSDLVQINKRISEIDVELDKLKGTIKRYDSLVDYSTVTINLYTPVYRETPTFGQQLKDGFNVLGNALKYIALFIIVISPVAAVIVGIVILIKYLKKTGKIKPRPTKRSGKKQKNDIVNNDADAESRDTENHDETRN